MKNFFAAVLIFVVAIAPAAEPAPTYISQVEVLSRLNQPWVQIVDIRSSQEFDGKVLRTLRTGFLPGSVNIPQQNAESLNQLKRNKEIIVVGFDSQDALVAADELKQVGFTHVRVLEGGWNLWARQAQLPAQNAQWVDIEALQTRVARLEQALAQK